MERKATAADQAAPLPANREVSPEAEPVAKNTAADADETALTSRVPAPIMTDGVVDAPMGALAGSPKLRDDLSASRIPEDATPVPADPDDSVAYPDPIVPVDAKTAVSATTEFSAEEEAALPTNPPTQNQPKK
jgi:hypothetical protein